MAMTRTPDDPADGHVGQPGLEPCARGRRRPDRPLPAPARWASPGRPERGVQRQDRERDHSRHGGDERRGQRGRGHLGRRTSRSDQHRREDRAAADPVDPADAAHHRGQGHQGRHRDLAGAAAQDPGVRAGRLSASQLPRGSRTAATTRSNTCEPGSSSTRITEPAMTPGSVPAIRDQGQPAAGLALPPVPVQRPGVATTLYSRLVGVTAGLGVPSTLTWKGSSSTAPEIPAGATPRRDHECRRSATICVQPGPSTE